MKKALIVGISDYEFSPIPYSVNDAQRIANILAKNDDLSPNFDCNILLSSEVDITENILKKEIKELFRNEAEAALLYFSGHGNKDELGGCLVTQDAQQNDMGVSLNDIISLANQSPAKEIIIILDCCHSGQIGENIQVLEKGISILASSGADQTSIAKRDGGVFTTIICDALSGLAADILGNVTVSSVYNYADKLLGAWEQRPIFKAYLSKMIPLRKCKARINLIHIRTLPESFKSLNHQFQLSPEYEPTATPRDKNKEETFGVLQKLTALNLVEPVGEDHMYFAAINNKFCQLTPLGKYYWQLANSNRI